MRQAATLESIQEKLLLIHRVFSRDRRAGLHSRMEEMWDSDVEELLGSRELTVLETEFGVEFNEDSAQVLYEANLGQAAQLLLAMMQWQGKLHHDPDALVNSMSPELMRQVLLEVWQTELETRQKILLAIETVNLRK